MRSPPQIIIPIFCLLLLMIPLSSSADTPAEAAAEGSAGALDYYDKSIQAHKERVEEIEVAMKHLN